MSMKLCIHNGEKFLSYKDWVEAGYNFFLVEDGKETPIEECENRYKIDEESGELVSFAEWIRRHG